MIVLFLPLDKREHLKNLLDMLFHTVYIQHNLRHVVMMLFDQIYSHPKEPFLKHQSGKRVHIVYIQYMYHKF